MARFTNGDARSENMSPKGCTCKEGHKLDCPVHGLNAGIDPLDHSWSLPENNPVGYPQDQPRYLEPSGKQSA